jgi:PAS domain S-box-containing protein
MNRHHSNPIESVIPEGTFQTVFENAYFGMVLVGQDGCFIKVNQAACDLFGYPEDELISKTFKDLTHPDDLNDGVELFDDLMSGKKKFAKMTKRYIHKNGAVIWALISTSAIVSDFNDNSQPDFLLTLFQDITSQKNNEFDLAEKEQQYRSIFEEAFDGILINDLNGNIVETNTAFCRMHGYSREELIGKHTTIVISPEDHSTFSEYLNIIKNDQLYTGRAVDIRKDGSKINVEVHGSPISYQGSTHVLGIVRDVTLQVDNQAALEKIVADRTREISALLEINQVATASLDPDLVMKESLKRILDLIDCEMGAIHLLEEEKKKLSLACWQNIPEEIFAEIKILPTKSSLPGKVLDHGEPVIIKDMIKDPATVPAAKRLLDARVYLGLPIRSKKKVVGVLVVIGQAERVFTDEEITLLTSICNQLGIAIENANLHEQAEEYAAAEERQRIAREIHDTIAQGLIGIKMQLEAVESALELGQIESAMERLSQASELASESLSEARNSVWALRSNHQTEKSLAESIQESAANLTTKANLEVSFDLEDDISPINSDLKNDLQKITKESITNALKHAQATQIKIQLKQSNHTVSLSITDNGQGFSVHKKQSSNKGGFGIISMHERIDRHGGNLKISSSPGIGTTVTAIVDISQAGEVDYE